MKTFLEITGAVTIIVVLIVGLSLLFAYPTMWVANYLFTPTLLMSVFGIAKLTFWKAFWLNFLCSSLLKSTNTSTK